MILGSDRNQLYSDDTYPKPNLEVLYIILHDRGPCNQVCGKFFGDRAGS